MVEKFVSCRKSATTCSPATGLPAISGCGSVWNWSNDMLGHGAAERICTGFAPWLVNDSTCGRLASSTASGPKPSSATEGAIALIPVPVIGKTKALSLSTLTGLFTANCAIRVSGHWAGEAPPALAGNHVQVSCGEKETAMVHDCPALRVNVDPAGTAQASPCPMSASVKLEIGRASC